MALKDAFIRSVRTALQTFIGLVIVTGVPVFHDLDEVKTAGIAFGFAAIGALFAGLVAFAQNVAEDNTSAQLPK